MLAELKILKSITILPEAQAVEVLWVNQIKRGDQVIAEENFRKSYAKQQKESFLQDVENAAHYANAMNW